MIPDGDKGFKGEGKLEEFFQGLKKFFWGYLSGIEEIDGAVVQIEDTGEDFFRILEILFLKEGEKFFCDLVMVERKDDIAEIEEDDLYGRSVHFFPLPTALFPLGRGRRRPEPDSGAGRKGRERRVFLIKY